MNTGLTKELPGKLIAFEGPDSSGCGSASTLDQASKPIHKF
ncbi:MAG TPA: hypothetical protein VN642_03495 [Dongiaceae bacterium]|nr:hypothetical protein [Dongiaceae bacterium]